jgi:hypothetical protein
MAVAPEAMFPGNAPTQDRRRHEPPSRSRGCKNETNTTLSGNGLPTEGPVASLTQ